MEIELGEIDFSANHYEVALEFARILHRIDYRSELAEGEEYRPLNFHVNLEKSNGGWMNCGRGSLIVPYVRPQHLTWFS